MRYDTVWLWRRAHAPTSIQMNLCNAMDLIEFNASTAFVYDSIDCSRDFFSRKLLIHMSVFGCLKPTSLDCSKPSHTHHLRFTMEIIIYYLEFRTLTYHRRNIVSWARWTFSGTAYWRIGPSLQPNRLCRGHSSFQVHWIDRRIRRNFARRWHRMCVWTSHGTQHVILAANLWRNLKLNREETLTIIVLILNLIFFIDNKMVHVTHNEASYSNLELKKKGSN